VPAAAAALAASMPASKVEIHRMRIGISQGFAIGFVRRR
jgi:hypothetical protein